MIKMQLESVVAGKEVSTHLIWIYENPKSREVEEVLKDNHDGIRVLFINDSYYIAKSYWYTHSEMVRDLRSHKIINRQQNYDGSITIDLEYDEIYVGDSDINKNEINTYKMLKRFAPKMISTGLFNNKEKIISDNKKK